MNESKKYLEYDVVEAKDLYGKTSSGWELVEVLRESKVERVEEEFSDQSEAVLSDWQKNSYQQRPKFFWVKPQVVMTSRFLVGRTELSNAIGALKSEIGAIEARERNEAIQSSQKIAELREQNSTLNKEVEKYDRSLREEIQQQQQANMYKQSRETNQKLESDLSKLRKALGDLRMNEILNPPKGV